MEGNLSKNRIHTIESEFSLLGENFDRYRNTRNNNNSFSLRLAAGPLILPIKYSRYDATGGTYDSLSGGWMN